MAVRKNLITLNHQFKQAIDSIIEEFNDPDVSGIPSAALLQTCYLEAAQSCLPFVFDRDNLKDRLLIDLDFEQFHGEKLRALMDVMPWFSAYICEEIYGVLNKKDMNVFLEASVHALYGAGENNCDIGYYIRPDKIAKLAAANDNHEILIELFKFLVNDFALDHLPDESLAWELGLCLNAAGESILKPIEEDLIKIFNNIDKIRDDDGDRIFLSDELLYSLRDNKLDKAAKHVLNSLDFYPRSTCYYVSIAIEFNHAFSNERINQLITENPNGIHQTKAEALLMLKLSLTHMDGYDSVFQYLHEDAKDNINSICYTVIEQFEEDLLNDRYIAPILNFIECAMRFTPEPEVVMKALSDTKWFGQIGGEIKSNPNLNRHLLSSELSI